MTTRKLTPEQLKQLRKASQESEDAQTIAVRAALKAESLKADAVDAQNRLMRLLTSLRGEYAVEGQGEVDFSLSTGAVLAAPPKAEPVNGAAKHKATA